VPFWLRRIGNGERRPAGGRRERRGTAACRRSCSLRRHYPDQVQRSAASGGHPLSPASPSTRERYAILGFTVAAAAAARQGEAATYPCRPAPAVPFPRV